MEKQIDDLHNSKVLLISMPWGTFFEPCLGISILKSVLAKNEVECDVLHASMHLLRHLKLSTFEEISQSWAANEFVFTREFEEAVSPKQVEILRRLVVDPQDCIAGAPLTFANAAERVDRILKLRQDVIPQFLDDLMLEIQFSKYSLVGFTCLFDQTVASLALARRIKRKYPGIMIAFGGYALQRPVGEALQHAFSEIDVVCYGDGEPVITPLWEASLGKRHLSEVPNITYRDSTGTIVESNTSIKIQMDDSPVPDYDDFFRQREDLKLEHHIDFKVGEMPVESSRGCWWGQKSHCTFCGIDEETLKYRVKSADVLISQLDHLHQRYNANAFRFSDYIMPLRYYQSFLPAMMQRGAPFVLHYETKSNLKKKQIDLCAGAGVRYLQPGIESFSSRVLRLMNKGVSGAQNVFTLSALFHEGIHTYYNLIFGFPFEEPSDYEQIVKVIPNLYHLVPPETTVPVLVTRYAPLAADMARFQATGPLKAHWRYDVIFSPQFLCESGLEPEDFCYYYESPYRSYSPELRSMHSVLQHQVLKWRDRFRSGKAMLTYEQNGEEFVVQDTRWDDQPRQFKLTKIHRELGERMRAELLSRRQFEEMRASSSFPDALDSALNDLLLARIVLEIDSHFIWLAMPAGTYEKLVNGACQNEAILSSEEWPTANIDEPQMRPEQMVSFGRSVNL